MKRTTSAALQVVGWREWLALPEFGLAAVEAKIDTGARSSALHASDLEYFDQAGTEMVRFHLQPFKRESGPAVMAAARVQGHRAVTNSGGRTEIRPVVRTRLRFRDELWLIELTLTRRDMMGFRMLLGRDALRGRFVVDPGRSYLGGRRRRRSSV